jgi:MFS family permease
MQTTHQQVPSIGPFELWKLAQVAVGLVAIGGLMFLIPLAIVEQGGTPADAGAVVALAGALGLLGPFLGGFADRFRAYRMVQIGSLTLLAISAIVFAIATEELTWLVAAALLGIGMAGLSVANPTLVVGAGFDEQGQAKALSMLQMSVPVGQVIGLAAVAGMSAIGFSIPVMFLVLAAVGIVLTLVVAAVNRPAVDRLLAAPRPGEAATAPPVTLRAIFVSQFGLVLGLTVLIFMSASAIEGQYPNYMQQAFDIDPSVSAGALSLIVLVMIPVFVLTGRWTARSGPRAPFIVSAIIRTGAGVVLLLLPKESGVLALIVFGIVMLAHPLLELNAATLAARTSPIGAGPGQGAVGAALAVAAMLAAILAGWLANAAGFASLAMITAITAAIATVIALIFLRAPASLADHE